MDPPSSQTNEGDVKLRTANPVVAHDRNVFVDLQRPPCLSVSQSAHISSPVAPSANVSTHVHPVVLTEGEPGIKRSHLDVSVTIKKG